MKRLLTTLLCSLFWLIPVTGQIKMTVSSKAELIPDDADAASYYRMTDINDNVCAIIKVVPDNPLSGQLVLNTKGGMVPVKSDEQARKNGEWWFWVSPTVTNIMFTCDGYTSTDWMGVSLQAGKVYRVKIGVESNFTIVRSFAGSGLVAVNIDIIPKDALVSYGSSAEIFDNSTHVTDGSFDVFLQEGKYYFKVESEFYETYTSEVTVVKGISGIEIRLNPAFNTLAITSSPTASDVYIDGKLVGTTPINVSDRVPKGKHSLIFRKDNYYVYEQEIVASGDGSLLTIPTATLPPQFGIVTLLCDDPEADLTLTDPAGSVVFRGKSGSKTQLNSKLTFKLEASRPSHISQSTGVTLGESNEGKEIDVSVDAPVPIYGELQISSAPSRAEVYIDGQRMGVTLFIQHILIGQHTVELKKEDYDPISFDVNILDGQITSISKALKKHEECHVVKVVETRGTENSHEWVDLGLPSGVKWATCNVGANKPEECGDYFSWGEVMPKNNYFITEYKWYDLRSDKYIKYNNNPNWGVVDNKTTLDPEDDAATANFGGNWRTPTADEWDEILNNCSWTWTEEYDINGWKVMGPNGNNIFLPAAGHVKRKEPSEVTWWGRYWSSSLKPDNSDNPKCFASFVQDRYLTAASRPMGFSVRPVMSPNTAPIENPVKNETKYVDLGLSVKWATCNLGASKPEEFGDYFAWGETEPKSDYSWSTYKLGSGDLFSKYNDSDKTSLDLEDDAAHVTLGSKWRMPTEAEWVELIENCTSVWVDDYNGTGVAGRIVTSNLEGYKDKSIFLPAAGDRYPTNLNWEGSRGTYWSSSVGTDHPNGAWRVDFYYDIIFRDNDGRYRCYGRSVRPVTE